MKKKGIKLPLLPHSTKAFYNFGKLSSLHKEPLKKKSRKRKKSKPGHRQGIKNVVSTIVTIFFNN